MTMRKGLGKGKGKGYYNIINKDKKVHSESAKGMKQPQKLNVHPTEKDLARHKWEHELMKQHNFEDSDNDKAPDLIDCDPNDPTEQGISEAWAKFKETLVGKLPEIKNSPEYQNLSEKQKEEFDKIVQEAKELNTKEEVKAWFKRNKKYFPVMLLAVPMSILISPIAFTGTTGGILAGIFHSFAVGLGGSSVLQSMYMSFGESEFKDILKSVKNVYKRRINKKFPSLSDKKVDTIAEFSARNYLKDSDYLNTIDYDNVSHSGIKSRLSKEVNEHLDKIGY